jgi:hypothetical protein
MCQISTAIMKVGEAAGVAASVHGYSAAMAWGAAILLAAVVPIVLIDAQRPAPTWLSAELTTYLT